MRFTSISLALSLLVAVVAFSVLAMPAMAFTPPSTSVQHGLSTGLDGDPGFIAPEDDDEEEKEDLDVDPPGNFPQIPPATLSLTAWSAIGPAPIVNGNNPGGNPTTGRIGGSAADPTDPNTIYAASVGGGIWKTTDGGTNWTPLTDGQATLWGHAVAVSASDHNTVYAGTGEPTNSITSFYGRGVLKSTDGGSTWALMGNGQFNRRSISRVVIHPTDPNTVYVSTCGGVNSLGQNRGVWKTTDGGVNWTNTTNPQVTGAQFSGNYSDLLMHPTDPLTLYCAVGSYNGASQNGVYKTTDGGANWSVAGNHPRGTTLGRINIAISKSNPLVVYSTISHPSNFGLYKIYKTVDGGTTWADITGATTNYMGGQGWYDQVAAVDPSNQDIVYVAGQTIVFKSENGGTSWTNIGTGADGNGPHVDHHSISFDSNGKAILTNDGGIWRLDNPTLGSIHWTDLNGNLQITQFIGIASHPTDPNLVYAGSQDNGTEKFTGVLGWTAIRGGDGGHVRVNPSTPATMYHTFYYSQNASPSFFERSTNGGSTWAVKVSGISNADAGNFYVPFVIDPSNNSRLLLGTTKVYETTNNADSWAAISTPGANGWGSASAIDAIGIAASDINTIYATAGGAIYVTFNRGATWTSRPISGVADHFHDLQVDPNDNLTAYIVRDRFNSTSVGHVFRTTDGGVTWTNISGDLPDIPCNAFALATNNPGQADDVYYVGSDTGVYRSVDGGNTWTVWATGMPNVGVFELEINRNLNLLSAGTHGRGAFQIQVPLSPSIAALPNASTVCGLAYTGPTPSATGSTPLTWALVAGPSGMTIDSGTGIVSWPTPIASQTAYTITIKASNDGGGFDTKSYLLKVKPGDFTGDGLADDADLPALVSCLLDPPNCSLDCAADVNNDTIIDGLDAQAWVNSSLTP